MNNVLLSYQKKWLNDKSPVKVIRKSRQIGITWTSALKAVLTASRTHGKNVWYMGYNFEMTTQFISDCRFWIDVLNSSEYLKDKIINNFKTDVLKTSIKFASGFLITALSSSAVGIRSKSGDYVIVDEADYNPDLQAVLVSAFALLIWGGEIEIISTHNWTIDGEHSKFNQLIKSIEAGENDYSLHRVDIEDALRDGLYQRICLKQQNELKRNYKDNWTQEKQDAFDNLAWTQEKEIAWLAAQVARYKEHASQELYCTPAKEGEGYFTRQLIEGCMVKNIPVVNFTCDKQFALKHENERTRITTAWCVDNLAFITRLPQSQYFFGVDFGRSGDLSVFVFLELTKDLKRKSVCVVELRNVTFEQQKQILFYCCDKLNMLCGGAFDATGNGQWLAEVTQQKYGKNSIEAVHINNNWYLEAMPKYKASFENKMIILPFDRNIIDDHLLIKVLKGIPKIPDVRTKDEQGQRHGDSAVAGAMAVYAIN